MSKGGRGFGDTHYQSRETQLYQFRWFIVHNQNRHCEEPFDNAQGKLRNEAIFLDSSRLFGMTPCVRLLRGVYAEHVRKPSADSVNVLAMTIPF